jgi:hypothetical protein
MITFWGCIQSTYKAQYVKHRDYVPSEPIDEIIEKEGLPASLDLLAGNKLSKIVREQQSDWEEFIAWDYAKYLYSKTSVVYYHDTAQMGIDELYKIPLM